MPIIKHIDFQVPDWGEFQQPPVQRLSYRGEVLADSPLVYLRMGESQGPTAFDEAGQRDAAVEGALVWGIPGALALDGDTAVGGAGTGGLAISETGWLPTGSSPRTIELWFRPNAGTTSFKGISYGGVASGTRIAFIYMRDNVSIFVVNCLYGVAGLSLSGKWCHAVLVFPDGAARCDEFLIYLNGQQQPLSVLFGDGSTPVNTSDSGLFINKQDGGSANDCDFDEVAIYGTALSAQRVLAHYQAGIAGGP